MSEAIKHPRKANKYKPQNMEGRVRHDTLWQRMHERFDALRKAGHPKPHAWVEFKKKD